jgi:hypothetical protein
VAEHYGDRKNFMKAIKITPLIGCTVVEAAGLHKMARLGDQVARDLIRAARAGDLIYWSCSACSARR